MHSRDVNTSFANALVDEWVRAGARHAVIAPGSRSAPLAIAAARDGRLTVHVVLDERSAAFFALGVAKRTGVPALLCCTSGTAAANFHPAVVEAHHANVPMLVCTADRPAELHDVGAPQTIDQSNLYVGTVRWSHAPGPPEDDDGAPARWRSLACRAFAGATGPRPGPVHLNLAFREPLVPTGAPLVPAEGRADGRLWTQTVATARGVSDAAAQLARIVDGEPRGIVVAGFGANLDARAVEAFSVASGWPVLADAVSSVRTGDAVSTYEALVRVPAWAEAHRPNVVLRIGAPLTSKVANAWLETVPAVLVDEHDQWLDPPRAATHRLVAPAGALLDASTALLGERRGDDTWRDGWRNAERVARRALDDALEATDEPFEGRIARDLAAAIPDGAHLVVASSIPVRALEWCMTPRDGIKVHANRGANGIDGFVSTVLGIAAGGASAPTVALCGDLCFLHDTNGLLAANARGLPAVFVVVDNDGGGIFSYLPQVELPEFETLFATPQHADIAAIASAHGVIVERVRAPSDLPGALKEAIAAADTRVLVVEVDRATSTARHRGLWDAVANAISGAG